MRFFDAIFDPDPQKYLQFSLSGNEVLWAILVTTAVNFLSTQQV